MDALRILIVDDDIIQTTNLRRQLEHMGHSVVGHIGSGAEALQTADALHPDLVLMDIQLEGVMNGVQAAEQLHTRYDIPVIYVTGHSDNATLEEAMTTLPFGYLLKPVTAGALRTTIEVTRHMAAMARDLRASERRYRLLVDSLTSGVAVYEAVENGADFVFKEFNQAAERIEGIHSQSVLGKRLTEVFPGVEDFGLLEILRRVWQTGIAEHVPGAYYSDTRVAGWRENYVYRLPTGEVVAVYNDVTESKRAEHALRHERDLLNRLMETTPIGITLVNRDGCITFANTQAEQILGYDRETLAQTMFDMSAWHITDHEGRPFPEAELPFSQVKATREPVYDVRHAIETPDRRRVLLSINAAPLFDENGQWDGMVSALQDVTERVREAQLRQERLTHELRALDALSGETSTMITAQSFGLGSLRANLPDLFHEFVQIYGELLELALEQRTYKVTHPISIRLRALAQRLGVLRAGPRDIVEIHTAALRARTGGEVAPLKARVYMEEGYLVALEMMGYLTSYYRHYTLGIDAGTTGANHSTAKTKGDDENEA